MNRKTINDVLSILLYVIVFFLIQLVMTYIVGIADLLSSGADTTQISHKLSTGTLPLDGKALVTATVLSSVLAMSVFIWSKWAKVSRSWLATHPWVTLVWVALAALGTIIPSEWIEETMALNMPEGTEKLFEDIMSQPLGYMSLGILAPLAEELVFRGAVLRKLLSMFDKRWHWVPIAISAIIFGAAHFNLPQFVHATLIGLLLGWMYYRTDSILPGVLFHWVNNTVAYLMFHLMPQMNDGKLIDLFHGSHGMVAASLLFSVCILAPSLFQLATRLKKA